MDAAIRQKLHDAYMELAEQATKHGRFEAASAFQYAAGLAFGMVVKVEEPKPRQSTCDCLRPVPSPHNKICLACGMASR
jgi:hypothetical protein